MWVYCLAINRELSDGEFGELAGTLEPVAAGRLGRIQHRESAVRALLGEILARTALSRHHGGAPSDLEFSVGPHGKPEPLLSNWQYNVSHSGDWVVCAVSDSQPVGVDVERVRAPNLRVARRYFHPRELDRLLKQPEHEKAGTFFEIWTAKESFLKAVGIGISVALNSFWADDETRTIRIDDPAPFARLGVEIESGWCFDPLPV
ncbi:MAG: 4'-phosphopantetheinyl transferase family protein, partial [Acidothermaceae bacterium]